MASPLAASHTVLDTYYPRICLLRDYLGLILPPGASVLPQDVSPHLVRLLSSVVVASQLAWDQHPKHEVHPVENPILEVIQVVSDPVGLKSRTKMFFSEDHSQSSEPRLEAKESKYANSRVSASTFILRIWRSFYSLLY